MNEKNFWANFVIGTAVVLFVMCIIAIILKDSNKKVTHIGREKHVVTSVKRHIPRSVQDEMNLYYDVTIDDTTTFKTLKNYSVGDTIYYEIYKINK
jgi:hypothetical protein